jgi:hypothetical protein
MCVIVQHVRDTWTNTTSNAVAYRYVKDCQVLYLPFFYFTHKDAVDVKNVTWIRIGHLWGAAVPFHA